MNNNFDLEKLKQAFENKDADGLAAMYADDFEQTEMDDVTPPNAPRKRTKQEVYEIIKRNQNSQVKFSLDNLVPGKDRAAYTITCHLPDGVKVVGNSIVEIRGGKIVKETVIQAREK